MKTSSGQIMLEQTQNGRQWNWCRIHITFLQNFKMGFMSYSVGPLQASPAFCNLSAQLVGPIYKLRRKRIGVNAAWSQTYISLRLIYGPNKPGYLGQPFQQSVLFVGRLQLQSQTLNQVENACNGRNSSFLGVFSRYEEKKVLVNIANGAAFTTINFLRNL